MLVVKGALHPKFEENGQSRFIRNGVGVRSDGTVMFAISMEEVSFGSFARLFRDALDCPDALYFDGVVSAFSDGKSTLRRRLLSGGSDRFGNGGVNSIR